MNNSLLWLGVAEHVHLGAETRWLWGKGASAPSTVVKSLVASAAACSAIGNAGVVLEAAVALAVLPRRRDRRPGVDNLDKPRIPS